MGNPVVLLDADGVLARCLQRWLSILNKRHGLSLKEEDVTDFHWIRRLPGLTPEQCWEPLQEKGFFLDLNVIPGSQAAVKDMQNRGWEVVIVTSPPHDCPYSYQDKVDWFAEYFPMIHRDDIIFASRKWRVKGDLLIDDGIHNLEAFPGLKVVFSAPHNKNYKGADLRISRWSKRSVDAIAKLLG